ncbi:MAG: TetR/AcrR family transcriptional regulator [Treponema sp.]|jgi:AcrR family transcriptional regulator|nr:TetR/AcrR family transcriptional regulator [Treponema sp.]
MGIAERKEREKAERKGLIMDCARDLIITRGAKEVSMTDIARKAELSKATVYLYFPSKEHLFRELSEKEQEKFIAHLKKLLTPGISALEIIHLFWKSYVEIYGDMDGRIALFTMRYHVGGDFLFLSDSMEKSFVIYSMLQEIIKQGIAEKTMNPDIDPAAATRAILYLFSYVVENSISFPGDRETGRMIIREIKKVFEIILKGIARPGIDPSLLVLSDPLEETDSGGRKISQKRRTP